MCPYYNTCTRTLYQHIVEPQCTSFYLQPYLQTTCTYKAHTHITHDYLHMQPCTHSNTHTHTFKPHVHIHTHFYPPSGLHRSGFLRVPHQRVRALRSLCRIPQWVDRRAEQGGVQNEDDQRHHTAGEWESIQGRLHRPGSG